MPSPRVPTYRKPKPALPPRARELAERMAEGATWKEAAAAMGIGHTTARTYRQYPAFKPHYLATLAEMRDGERGRNLKVATVLRDEGAKEASAAHRRVAIDAMRFIEDRDGPANVNVNVGLGVNVAPGYIVDVSQYAAQSERILKQARSTGSITDDRGDSLERVVEHDEAETAPAPKTAPATPGGPAFGSWTERLERADELPPLDSRKRASLARSGG